MTDIQTRYKDYGFAVIVVIFVTLAAFVMHRFFEPTNLIMLYLLGSLIVSLRGKRGPAAFTAFISVLCFDVFFIPPRFQLAVHDIQYVWTFVVMFLTSMVISHLTIRLREEARAAHESEQRAVWLLEKAKQAEIAAETERMRSSLLSSVSHDFRTPLSAIVGSAETLLAREDISKIPIAKDLLKNIGGEANRLSRLVQNLLQATRLELGVVQLHKDRYPLEEIIGDVLERMSAELKNHPIDIQLPEDLPLVPLDPDLLTQVLINLFENIVRHTPPKTRTVLTAHVRNQSVWVSVSDEGPGISEKDRNNLFEKFHHGSESPGAGLGLAICRSIIQAHGGQMTASTRSTGGATFEFSLPLETHP